MSGPKVTTLRGAGDSAQENGTAALSPQERLTALMEEDGLTQAQVAREAEIKPSTLSQWLSGSYAGDVDKVTAKVERWLDAYKRRQDEAARMPDAPSWVETPTAGKVYDALSYAHMAGDVVVIYGGAGLGKTETIEYYAAREPGVWVATMSPATGSVMAALGEVCHALGIEESGRKARMQRAILRRMHGVPGVLVIDEAQNLTTSALDQMRALHDRGVGLVLVGNETVYSGMTGSRAQYLDRLFSRVGKRVKLGKPTRADVDALAGEWGISDSDSLAVLREIGGKPGALRTVTKVLRLACLIAQGAGDALSADYIRMAYRDLEG